jgi:hypothetical protein
LAAKAADARYTAVLPILNRGCSIPTTVPLPLSDDLTFRKVKGDDLAVITEADDEAANLLRGGTYTLTFEGFDPNADASSLNIRVLSALFTLNVLGSGGPLSLDRAYILRSLRKTTVSTTHALGNHQHSNLEKFEISKGTDLTYASNLFAALSVALEKHPPLRITVSRFNSSIGRSALDDKLIDLCIALESVFQSQTEISFQFALYNTLLSEGDEKKRQNIFKMLKKLYNQRSNVVHGNKDLDEQWVKDNWDDLLRIAKAAILRKVEFLSLKNHDQWKEYLETLALGTANG